MHTTCINQIGCDSDEKSQIIMLFVTIYHVKSNIIAQAATGKKRVENNMYYTLTNMQCTYAIYMCFGNDNF